VKKDCPAAQERFTVEANRVWEKGFELFEELRFAASPFEERLSLDGGL
jgi:hypothetical protein